MKITIEQLRRIIREEITTVKESAESELDRLGDKLANLEMKGKAKTPEYKALQAKYKELEKKSGK